MFYAYLRETLPDSSTWLRLIYSGCVFTNVVALFLTCVVVFLYLTWCVGIVLLILIDDEVETEHTVELIKPEQKLYFNKYCDAGGRLLMFVSETERRADDIMLTHT